MDLSGGCRVIDRRLLRRMGDGARVRFRQARRLVSSTFAGLTGSSGTDARSGVGAVGAVLRGCLSSGGRRRRRLGGRFVRGRGLSHLLTRCGAALGRLSRFGRRIGGLGGRGSQLGSLSRRGVGVLGNSGLGLVTLFSRFVGTGVVVGKGTRAFLKAGTRVA